MSTSLIHEGMTTGVVKEVGDAHVVLVLPGTDYRLRLAVDEAAAAQLRGRVGHRVRGVIEARSLRIHSASGGGRFIEPVSGEPRIVAGTVIQADERNHRVLINVGTPMWLTTRPGQDFRAVNEGGLVNCYVESGTRFVPVRD